MSDQHELIIKLLAKILGPLLNTAGKKITTEITKKTEQTNHQNDSQTQENRIVTKNGYTKIAPLLPPIKKPSSYTTPAFKESHKLGHTRPASATEETQAVYNDYKIQADKHKEERKIGEKQQSTKHLGEQPNNEKRHFSLFRK